MASYLVLSIQHKCMFFKIIHSEQNPIRYLNFRKLHNPQKGGASFHIQHSRIALLSEFVMERCINRATDQIQEHLWWETMASNFQTNLTAWIYNYTPFAPDLPVSHGRRPLTDQIQYQWKKIKNSRVCLHFCRNRCLLEQVCWSWRSRSISTLDCLGMIAVPYCFHEDPYRMINFWIIQVAVRCLLQETPSPCGFPDALYNTANQSSCNYFFFYRMRVVLC